MKDHLLGRIAGVMLACWMVLGAAAPASGQTSQAAAPGEVVAILPASAPVDEFIALALSRGYELLYQDDLKGLSLAMITLKLPYGVDGPLAIADLENVAPYSIVGVNHVYELVETPKPRLFARGAIGWPEQTCRVSLRIGVVDTAVAAERLGVEGERLVSASFLRDDEAPSRRDHGAAIAAILAGPSGLLPDATLFAATAVMEDDAGKALARVDHLARSINWMAENGVTVVNLSLAGPENKIFAEVVRSAAEQGMILVAAVGNAGPDSEPLYPAAYEQVIAVTAIDAALAIFPDAVRGTHVDVAAPGVDIWLFGADKPRYASGTSLAAPYVAARLAVASASEPLGGVEAARALLGEEAQDLGPAGRDPVFGAGLLRGPTGCF